MKGFFQEIKNAVSDFNFYKVVKDFDISRSVKYIFSLILLITLVLTVRFSIDFRKGVNLAADWALVNLPPIQITNGVASVEAKQPYIIEEEGFGLVIDTTGEVMDLNAYERGILLMNDRLFYKESDVKTETYSLSDIDSLVIDENFINSIRKNAVWILFPIMLIGAAISASIAKFFQIFAFSLISIAASTMVKVKLTYKQLFNIGVFAITPSYILGGLLTLIGLQLPLFGIVYSGLYIAYLIMAVKTCREVHETPA